MTQAIQPRFRVRILSYKSNSEEKAETLITQLVGEAIVYNARLNKSGKSYYVYLPRRYNKQLEHIHRKRREVRVIIIPR